MIYPIFAYGSVVLKKKAIEIEKDSLDLKKLSTDMFETMYQAHGVGLAAPQIGKSIRLFVVDSNPLEEEDAIKKVFVNPEILEKKGDNVFYEEGCLSIPDIREDISRNESIVIRYFDENWTLHTEEFDGINARIMLHEYDHLEGALFTDYLSGLKKRLLKRRLNDISKGKIKVDYEMRFPM